MDKNKTFEGERNCE